MYMSLYICVYLNIYLSALKMRRKKIGANPGWLDLYVPKRTCRFNDSVPTYSMLNQIFLLSLSLYVLRKLYT